MKYLDEYRDPRAARVLVDQIREATTRPWTLLEVCGGQAHNLMRFGIDRTLPVGLELAHGPGCPVCLATSDTIDQAQQVAAQPDVIFCTISDLLRIPGSFSSLAELRQGDSDIRVVYSALDALGLARKNPGRPVVFFAVGFETTAPTTAAAILEAERFGLDNFSVLGSHKRIGSALEAILRDEDRGIHALLAPGHVCSVMGTEEYEQMAERLKIPVIITGCESVDLLEGLLSAVRQLESGSHKFENLYPKGVRREGNPKAKTAVDTVFETAKTSWRGLGVLPDSTLALREAFRRFDATKRFAMPDITTERSSDCRGSEVMTGRIKPVECPAFGVRCTLDKPMGAPMVSAEGTCAAYYRHRSRAEGSVLPARVV